MTLNDTQKGYGLVSIVNHWATAVLIATAIGLGWIFEDMERGPLKGELFAVHVAVGLTVLALALVRIAWRYANATPALAGQPAAWERIAARAGHVALMAMLVIMPLSGILMVVGGGHELAFFGLTLIPASGQEIEALNGAGHVIHGLGANLLIALIAIHILAAFKHHLFDRDATLTRMLGRAPAATLAPAAE